MSDSCIVLIAAARVLPVLEQQLSGSGRLLPFSDGDAVKALQAILAERPALIVLERVFATTPRGTALLTRIKADASLNTSEIRVVAHDGSYSRTVRRSQGAPAAASQAGSVQAKLDPTGTRRSDRRRMREGLEAKVDGNAATLIDLSPLGAQVLSPTVLRPNQRVQITFADDAGSVSCRAMIAWASFERPLKGTEPCYRAGLEFLNANTDAVDGFCKRNAV